MITCLRPRYHTSHFLRIFAFSSSSRILPSPKPEPHDSLKRRISRSGDPTTSIIPVLEEWLDQGNQVEPANLHSIVKMLRKFKRSSHALQILEWMGEQKMIDKSVGHTAIQLDLIAKVRGLEEAEKCFEAIPEEERDYRVYGALLNCYVTRVSRHKAEATFQKMKELGFVQGLLPYNLMLNLYTRLGKSSEAEKFLQEMEEGKVEPNRFTVNTRLHAYAALSNIEGLEKFLSKCEADPSLPLDWSSYTMVANAYLKAGATEKAVAMLNRSEQLVNPKSRKLAYEVFMPLYGTAGKKEEVYRIWNLYKRTKQVYNMGYISVMSGLLKVEDIEGVERVYEEWEREHIMFDIRIPHLLITGYCKKGMMEKAEEVVQKRLHRKVVGASTWERLALGYKTAGMMEEAVESWKKAVEVSVPGWRPNRLMLVACLGYMKGKGEEEQVKEVVRRLKERAHISDAVMDELEGAGFKPNAKEPEDEEEDEEREIL